MPPAAELDHVVDELANSILGGAPITVRNSKRMLNRLLWAQGESIRNNRELWKDLDGLIAEAHGSEDVREGLTAFFEHRPARFVGR